MRWRHIRQSEGEPVHIRKNRKKENVVGFILLCMHTRSVSLVFSSPMRVKKLVLYDGPPTRFVWTERLQLCALDGYPVGKKKNFEEKERKKEGNPTQTQKNAHNRKNNTLKEKKKEERKEYKTSWVFAQVFCLPCLFFFSSLSLVFQFFNCFPFVGCRSSGLSDKLGSKKNSAGIGTWKREITPYCRMQYIFG